jgi:hypothetical protein
MEDVGVLDVAEREGKDTERALVATVNAWSGNDDEGVPNCDDGTGLSGVSG